MLLEDSVDEGYDGQNIHFNRELIDSDSNPSFAYHNDILRKTARVFIPGSNLPGLAVSRSFGDEAVGHLGVTSSPEVTFLSCSPAHKFIVLATDGLWEVSACASCRRVETVVRSSRARRASTLSGNTRMLMQERVLSSTSLPTGADSPECRLYDSESVQVAKSSALHLSRRYHRDGRLLACKLNVLAGNECLQSTAWAVLLARRHLRAHRASLRATENGSQ
eukprot:753154-Hanusia_phi.AAC.14